MNEPEMAGGEPTSGAGAADALEDEVTESTDSAEATEALEPAEAAEPTEAIEFTEAIESTGATAATDAVEPAEAAEAAQQPTEAAVGATLELAPLPEGIVVRRVVVEVPATTANLGAGYDALALALDLRDRFEVELRDEPGVELAVEGEGAGILPAERDNRFVIALETGLRWALGQVPPGIGWRIRMVNRIPLSRGLGSSAAATVGGLVAADAFAGGRLNERRLLTLCIELEGHPDNAAAALLGGFVVIALVDGRPETVRFDVPRDLRAVVFIPEVHYSTSAMRAALPREVPHRDAAFNLGRVALGVAGLASGRYELLRAATEDRLHEPYRAEVFQALPKLLAAARAAGAIGACLSGSGSAVIAFGDSLRQLTAIESSFLAAAAEAELAGVAQIVMPRNLGAVVLEAK